MQSCISTVMLFKETLKAKQPGPVTHVGSFMPFVVDITDYIKWNEENQIAVRVSNSKGTFFAWPGFGENEGFGQAMGGIAASVYLHKKNKVHIPYNSYTPLKKWGNLISVQYRQTLKKSCYAVSD